jgi:hypothetical protein
VEFGFAVEDAHLAFTRQEEVSKCDVVDGDVRDGKVLLDRFW